MILAVKRRLCIRQVFVQQIRFYHKHHDHAPVAPKLNIKWYYATDVPLSKPEWFKYTKEKDPQSFIPFSDFDSKRLEKKYQQHRKHKETKPEDANHAHLPTNVEVNEDKLFQVDISKMALSPVYWEGPIYEVRRGTWFNSSGLPLDHKLALQLEAGYQEKKPYLFSVQKEEQREKNSEAFKKSLETLHGKLSKKDVSNFNKRNLNKEKLELSLETLKATEMAAVDITEQKDVVDLGNGNLVLYGDGKSAAVFPRNINSELELGIIRNFLISSFSLLSVEKVQRGYTEDFSKNIFDSIPENPIPGLADTIKNEVTLLFTSKMATESAATELAGSKTASQEDAKSKMQSMLESDYDHDISIDKSERRVEHLIFCIHGIGQVLGTKYQSIDFTHNINVLRNTMKDVYQADAKYKNLAHALKDVHDYELNNTIQVLPISWRHKIDFQPAKNFELFDDTGKYRLPNLSQINVDGVKPLRNILGDVVLDILLYYEPHYIQQVFKVVIEELNRVYALYKERNPQFKGKVHIMGHSLGSAISFDIVSQQLNQRPLETELDLSKDLTFDVENLFCVGSPVGVFKLLSQLNIAARSSLPDTFNSRDLSNTQNSPKCANLYNVFHSCDPVGYRMEPLVSPKFANFKPEEISFAVEGFNTQIKNLSAIGDTIQQTLTSVFSKTRNDEKVKVKRTIDDEDALGDIIKNIVVTNTREKDILEVEMRESDMDVLARLNRNGRVDYCLPTGVFDISIVSAISAHVSYFEDQDTAGFIMKEVLTKSKDVNNEHKKVSIYKTS